jgi:signal transduction histidine kinase
MVTQVDELDQTMRRIAIELRPPMLDDLGLLATLEWQIEEVHQRTGLTYTIQLPDEYTPLDIDRTTALFRIFQEALTNVVRHASASRVDICVVQDAKAVYLVIRDNGQGMTATRQSQRHALGILGMHERAQVWGGEVTIQSHRVSGTTVTVRMPYRTPIELEASHDSSPRCR